jgi:hypothetical protein
MHYKGTNSPTTLLVDKSDWEFPPAECPMQGQKGANRLGALQCYKSINEAGALVLYIIAAQLSSSFLLPPFLLHAVPTPILPPP